MPYSKQRLNQFVMTALVSAASFASVHTSAIAEKLEGRLDIVAWPGYMERGESDRLYDWVTPFEKQTGCKVSVKTASTADEMVSLMSQGVYDLVTASGDATLRLIAGKRVQPIDTARIKDWQKLDSRFINAPWYTVEGKAYGVPFQWGPDVLMYNTKIFKSPPTSWAVVFNEQTLPDGKSNKGRVQAYDGAIVMALAANYLKSARPELKIVDPYELNATQYAAVLELLRKQHKLIHRYWRDVNVQVTDFKSEGVVASGSWPFQVNLLKGEKQPIASTIPAEGTTGWADTTMLHSQARNPGCAYAWLNWSLSDRVQAPLAEWFGSNPVTKTACTASTPGKSKPCITNGFDQFDKLAVWKTPQANCKSQAGQCIPYSRWTTDYIAIIGGH